MGERLLILRFDTRRRVRRVVTCRLTMGILNMSVSASYGVTKT